MAEQIQRFPDATLAQHAQYWEQDQGMQVSRWSVGRAIKRMGITRKKKTLGASERDEEARRMWREEMKTMDATKLVIVDETGSNIGLTPLYAWARHLASELSAASRVIMAKIPPMLCFSFPQWDGSCNDLGRLYGYPGF